LPHGYAQQQICNLFEIDARFCIGAGAMIIAVKPDAVLDVLQRLQQNNIRGTVIGESTAKEQGYKLLENGEEGALPYYPQDAYWAAFFKAYKNGWK
jgi:hydrogenase expression/formation protein HypE